MSEYDAHAIINKSESIQVNKKDKQNKTKIDYIMKNEIYQESKKKSLRENEKAFKPSHQRARSDTTGITKSLISNQARNVTNLKMTIGDLMSGKAFDINCICSEKQIKQMIRKNQDLSPLKSLINNLNVKKNNKKMIIQVDCYKIESSNNSKDLPLKKNIILSPKSCKCNALRIEPELEFTKALVSIGKKLVRFSSKEHKSNIKLMKAV